MEKLLIFLSGKKAVIASVILTVSGYLAAKQILGEAEVVLIGSLVAVIFGSASYVTGQMFGRIKDYGRLGASRCQTNLNEYGLKK
jgi:membrane protein DedA with SNARE-associated domain